MKKTLWLLLLLMMSLLSFADLPELKPQKIMIVPELPTTLTVTLSLNKPEGSVYQPGEIITLTFRTNRDAYVVIYDTEANGRTSILFPNQYQQDNFVKANQPVTIPQGYKLKIGGEIGKEYVQIVASTQQFATYNQWTTTFSASNPFQQVTMNAETELKVMIQKIMIVPDQPTPEWNSFSTYFYVGQKPPSSGTVNFSSNPSGAQIMLDGNWVNKTTSFMTTLLEGQHWVRYYLPNYQLYEESFTVTGGTSSNIHGNLSPILSLPAALNISSFPSGATIYLDGQIKGATQMVIQGITPGVHVLRLTLRGFQPFEQQIQFSTGEMKLLNVPLQPEIIISRGTLGLSVDPQDSTVMIDGMVYNTSGGNLTVTLDAGNHNLVVSKPNYITQSLPFTIQGNQFTSLNIKLNPEQGTLLLSSSPDSASIYINGLNTNTTTTRTLTLTPGVYTITLKKTGFQDWSQMVTIFSGANSPLNATLTPITAKMNITPNINAVLYIDGKSYGTVYAGNTFNKDLQPGNHEILLIRDGYYSFLSIFTMEAGQTYDLSPFLTQIN